MRMTLLRCLGLLIMIGVFCSACGAIATYTVTDLGTLGGTTSVANAINSYGQVVGYSTNANGQQKPFLWSSGEMTGIMPEANPASYYGINNIGEVIGGARLWTNGESVYVDGIGHSINDQSQVVGYRNVYDPVLRKGFDRAYIWQNGSITDLGTLATAQTSYAYDINNQGNVVGGSGSAFLWQNGVMTDIGFIAENTPIGAYALSINNSGVVVGHSDCQIPKGPAYCIPFIWKDGVMRRLPGGSVANSINDLGQIVGNLNGSYFSPNIACLWEQEVYYDLNTLIPSGTGWYLKEAYDINNSGQIVGWGYLDGQQRAYLLTPVPEPSSLVVLALGAGVVVGRRRRRK